MSGNPDWEKNQTQRFYSYDWKMLPCNGPPIKQTQNTSCPTSCMFMARLEWVTGTHYPDSELQVFPFNAAYLAEKRQMTIL